VDIIDVDSLRRDFFHLPAQPDASIYTPVACAFDFCFFLSFFQHFPRNLFDFLLVFRLMLAVLQMVSFLFYLFLHVCVWGEKRRAIDVLVMEPNTHGACCAPYFLVCFLFLPLNFLVISYAGIIITCVAAVVEREGKIKSFYFFGGGV
jgi:hypothetical protein